MKGTIVIRPEEGLAEVTYAGPVTFADRCDTLTDLEQALPDASTLRFLLDFTDATEVAEPTVEGLRRFIDRLSTFRFARGSRIAMVSPTFEHAAATESMRRAMHYDAHRFTDRTAAMAWLREPPSADE